MARFSFKPIFAIILALLISAGQVCACAAEVQAANAATSEMERAAHLSGAQNSTHHDAAKGQGDHQHNAPGHDCGHCDQLSCVKGSTMSDLNANLATPSSYQKDLARDNAVPRFSNATALQALQRFALHDPPTRTPVTLKIRLLN